MVRSGNIAIAPGAFRLVLAAMVVFSHVTVFQTGRAAVMLFFVLSGYWVSALWARTEGPARLRQFFLNRALRIWPLYLAVLLACAIGLGRGADAWSLLLFGVASRAGDAPIGTEWSLDVEVQFYAILPLLALAMARLRAGLLVPLMAALTAAGWLLWSAAGMLTALKFLPAFLAGMAIRRLDWRPGDRAARLSLWAFALATAAVMLLPPTRAMFFLGAFGGVDEDLFAMLWVAPLLPYLAASVAQPSSPRDKLLGDFSYPLYLVHAPLMAAAEHWFEWRSLAGVSLLLVLVAAATWLLHRLVDRPSERWRKALVERAGGRQPAMA